MAARRTVAIESNRGPRRFVVTSHMFRSGLVTALAVLAPLTAQATPTTTYWTVSTANCQAKGVPHVTYDTYYGKSVPPPAAGARTYPVDTGLTIGVLPSNKLQAEV